MHAPARNTDPITSHLAAAHMQGSGALHRQQSRALAAVMNYPGLTSNELAKATGICRFELARRLPEVAEAGLVVRGAPKRCSVSGRQACTWHTPVVGVAA